MSEMQEDLRDQVLPAAKVAVAHVFLALALLGFFLYRMPGYMDVYRELNAELPTATKIVLNIGEFLVAQWFWLLIPALLFLALDLAAFVSLRMWASKKAAAIWSWVLGGVLAAFLAGCLLAVRLPLMDLLAPIESS